MSGGESDARPIPVVHYEEDEETARNEACTAAMPVSAVPIIYDDEALIDEPTSAAAFGLESAALSHAGRVRRNNEDNYGVIEGRGLFVVADGMGGHYGGAVASELAVRSIVSALTGGLEEVAAVQALPRRADELARAIHAANGAVRSAARAHRELTGMGTTVVAALFAPEKRRLYVGHVGDSRCYRLRMGRLERLTEDHTMMQVGVTGDDRSNLARSVGGSSRLVSDIVIVEPRIGDVYLLCSDGLTKMVPEDLIERVLREETDPNEASEWLVDQANRHGGEDNVTVIVARVMPAGHALR